MLQQATRNLASCILTMCLFLLRHALSYVGKVVDRIGQNFKMQI